MLARAACVYRTLVSDLRAHTKVSSILLSDRSGSARLVSCVGGEHMKPFERLIHRVTLRRAIVVAVAMVLVALSSTSERVMARAGLASTVAGVSAAPPTAAGDHGAAIRPFRVNVPKADLADLRR